MIALQKSPKRQFQPALLVFLSSAWLHANAALATDAIEAAKTLADGNQTDPNGFTLMVVSICMLFVFALTLIIATSIHVFKKPKRGTSAAKTTQSSDEASYTSSTPRH